MAAAFALIAPAAQAQDWPLNASVRQATVQAVARAMRTNYVLPAAGVRAAARIEAELAAGSYSALDDPQAFAERLTADLRREAPDQHLRLAAIPAAPRPASVSPPPAAGAPPRPPPQRYPGEAGVTRADILPGNVGYLQLINFTRTEYAARPAIDRAMAALADTRALILDLRGNVGGGPGGGYYLLSHFLPEGEPIVIGRLLERKPGADDFTTTEFRSLSPRHRYLGKPVYVLIGPRTFSGGELFAYDMQAMKLARLVGQSTRGGAHSAAPWPVNEHFILSLPTQRFVSPVTGTNWEGRGVSPDIASPGPEALRVALRELGVVTPATDFAELSERRVFEPRAGPLPRTEATLRRLLDGFASGRPDFDLMGPGFRKAATEQIQGVQAEFARDGKVATMAYVGPDPEGMDVFDVTFENAKRTCRVLLDPSDRVEAQFCGPRLAR